MAQTIAVTVTCDICGSAKDAQTRRISLDGQAREIDLCGKDARALDKVAAKYVPHARKVRRTASTGRRTRDPAAQRRHPRMGQDTGLRTQ